MFENLGIATTGKVDGSDVFGTACISRSTFCSSRRIRHLRLASSPHSGGRNLEIECSAQKAMTATMLILLNLGQISPPEPVLI